MFVNRIKQEEEVSFHSAVASWCIYGGSQTLLLVRYLNFIGHSSNCAIVLQPGSFFCVTLWNENKSNFMQVLKAYHANVYSNMSGFTIRSGIIYTILLWSLNPGISQPPSQSILITTKQVEMIPHVWSQYQGWCYLMSRLRALSVALWSVCVILMMVLIGCIAHFLVFLLDTHASLWNIHLLHMTWYQLYRAHCNRM